jgi:hypothetical protein
LIPWKSAPPIAPIENAPPQSSTILQGLREKKTHKRLISSFSLIKQ